MAPTVAAAKHAERVVDESVAVWDAYVSELGRADGEFIGGGSRALGLDGAPQSGATWDLMNGVHPVTGERFHTPYWTKVPEQSADGRRRARVPSYAAVFAAPKSASLLLATGYREAVLESHRAAFAEAMRFVETQWLVRDRSGSHASLGVLATSYEHHTSRVRVPEPHLHTHVTLMNFAQRASDGKWLAIDYAHFLRVQKSAGIVYQAALRRQLAQRIAGVEFELRADGTADIAQIPALVREAYSTRHAEVLERDAELAAMGIRPGLRRMDYAAYETRSAKGEIDPRQWLAEQQDALAGWGITDESIAAWTNRRTRVTAASWEVRREELADRLFGPAGLTEKSNTFNRWDVMEAVGMTHYADMTSFELLVERTDELLADPRVVAVGEHGRYTVAEILALERSVLKAHRQNEPAEATGSNDRAIVEELIGEAEARLGWRFNPGQREMIEGLVLSDSQMEVVEALAGTGKTKTLGMLAEVLEAQGVQVIGAAPTGRARLELIQEAGIKDSYTLASLKVRRANGEQIFDRSGRFVLAVDEAGFSATRELADVLNDAIAAGGRVVLVGDSGQLGSVGAGGLFAAISRERAARDQHVYRLTEVRRQQTLDGGIDHVEVRALAALHDGEPEEWIALREKRGQLHIHVGEDAGRSAIKHAAALYLDALERHDAKDLYLLAADNAVREVVNQRVRAELVDRGVIIEAGEIGGRRFAEGERVALRANEHEQDLANGMRATILKVDVENGTLTIAIDGQHGGIATLDREYVTGVTESGVQRVQGGYANTTHTSQGGTSGETFIVGAAQSFDKERAYVPASRAKYATHLLTWDGSAPEHFAEHELTAAEQTQEVRDQLHDALQRTGVEETATEQIAAAGEQLQLDLEAAHSEQLVDEQEFDIDLTPEQEAALERAEAELIDDSEQLDRWAATNARLESDQRLADWRERRREIETETRAQLRAGEIGPAEANHLTRQRLQENDDHYRELLSDAIRADLDSGASWMNSIPESLRPRVAYTRLADGITDPRIHPVTESRYGHLWKEVERQRFAELPEDHKQRIRLNELRAELATGPEFARRFELTKEIASLTVREPWATELIPEPKPSLSQHVDIRGRPDRPMLQRRLTQQRDRLLEHLATHRVSQGVTDPTQFGLDVQASGVERTLSQAIELRDTIEIFNNRIGGIERGQGIDPDIGMSV